MLFKLQDFSFVSRENFKASHVRFVGSSEGIEVTISLTEEQPLNGLLGQHLLPDVAIYVRVREIEIDSQWKSGHSYSYRTKEGWRGSNQPSFWTDDHFSLIDRARRVIETARNG